MVQRAGLIRPLKGASASFAILDAFTEGHAGNTKQGGNLNLDRDWFPLHGDMHHTAQ